MKKIISESELIDTLNSDASHINKVFIDFDGVVIDSEPMQYKAYEIILNDVDVKFREDHFKEKCLGKSPLINAKFLIDEFTLPFQADELVQLQSNKSIELILENSNKNWFVDPLLNWCNSIDVIPEIISAGITSNIARVLSVHNMENVFRAIHSMNGKPQGFTKQDAILELTNGDASKSLIIEDSVTTLKLAAQIDMFRIGVRHEYNFDKELDANFIVESDSITAGDYRH